MNIFDDSDSEIEPLGADLVPPAPILEKRISEVDFDGLLDCPLKLHEDLSRGCGGQIWPAGECLSKYCLKRFKGTNDLQGKRIVELGAGGGIVGLAVASAFRDQNPEVFITDQIPMMDLMKRNIELNQLPVKAELYDWGEQIPEALSDKPIDIVLAADCVYFEPAFPLLEKTLIDLVQEGTIALFCFKRRRRADLKFIKSITKKLDVVEIKDYPDYEHYSKQTVYLYIMTKKSTTNRA